MTTSARLVWCQSCSWTGAADRAKDGVATAVKVEGKSHPQGPPQFTQPGDPIKICPNCNGELRDI